jgi:hypothetical protein
VPIVEISISGMSEILYEARVLEVAKILFVTDSGAGPPFARLYLIPKSFLGPGFPNVSLGPTRRIRGQNYLRRCGWQ